MGVIKSSRTLFFTTSPRSPKKLIPEIALLVDNFSGQTWSGNEQVQEDLPARSLLQPHLREIPLRSILHLVHEIVLLARRRDWGLLIFLQQFS